LEGPPTEMGRGNPAGETLGNAARNQGV